MNFLAAAKPLFIINKGLFLLQHILQPPDHIQDTIKPHKSTLDKHICEMVPVCPEAWLT